MEPFKAAKMLIMAAMEDRVRRRAAEYLAHHFRRDAVGTSGDLGGRSLRENMPNSPVYIWRLPRRFRRSAQTEGFAADCGFPMRPC